MPRNDIMRADLCQRLLEDLEPQSMLSVNFIKKTGTTSTRRPHKSPKTSVRSVRANPFEPYRSYTEALKNRDVNVLRELVDLNNDINNQEGQLDYERQRIARDISSLHEHLVLLDLHPHFTRLRNITARAKNTENTVEEQLTALYNLATEDQKLILQNARNLGDLERKILLLREKYTAILREQPLEQLDVYRLQTIRQIYCF